MNKVIKLNKPSQMDSGMAMLKKFYNENIKNKKTKEYALIMNELSRKKDTVFKKRDIVLLKFLFEYNKDFEFLVNLKWIDLNKKNYTITLSEKVYLKVDEELFKNLIDYKKAKKDDSEYIFSSKDKKQQTTKFLKSIYKRYKTKISKDNMVNKESKSWQIKQKQHQEK